MKKAKILGNLRFFCLILKYHAKTDNEIPIPFTIP